MLGINNISTAWRKIHLNPRFLKTKIDCRELSLEIDNVTFWYHPPSSSFASCLSYCIESTAQFHYGWDREVHRVLQRMQVRAERQSIIATAWRHSNPIAGLLAPCQKKAHAERMHASQALSTARSSRNRVGIVISLTRVREDNNCHFIRFVTLESSIASDIESDMTNDLTRQLNTE